MTAAATFAAWETIARSGNPGGSNLLRIAGLLYAFSAPERLKNGALTGHFSVKDRAEFRYHGAYKIAVDGKVVAIPDELIGTLPLRAPATVERPDPFSTDDIEDLPLCERKK